MTITVRLPKDLEVELRTRLAGEEIALSDYVCDAIAEKLQREQERNPSPYELGRELFGKYSSGRSDLAENAASILRERLLAKHRR